MLSTRRTREPLLSILTRRCDLLVDLPDVAVLAVSESGEVLRVVVETRQPRPVCPGCGGSVSVKDRADVEHDLPCFGRRAVLVWRKRRWGCPTNCGAGSFTETAGSIAGPR